MSCLDCFEFVIAFANLAYFNFRSFALNELHSDNSSDKRLVHTCHVPGDGGSHALFCRDPSTPKYKHGCIKTSRAARGGLVQATPSAVARAKFRVPTTWTSTKECADAPQIPTTR